MIFLDFGGVLNDREWLRTMQTPEKERTGEGYFNNPCAPHLIARLQRLVDATGAKIVFSTSWRILSSQGELQRYLMKAGFRPDRRTFLGVTPRLHRTPEGEQRVRGHEIQAWLDVNLDVIDFVILDDDSDMAHLLPRLVRTNCELGIQDGDIDRAIEMLGGGARVETHRAGSGS